MDANGREARPWLTTVIDDYSRAVVGYTVFIGAPSALNTWLALRQAIWRKSDPAWPMCGLPDRLYVDHGADFTSLHLDQAAADLRFQLIYSTVGRPQGRGKVERLFRTINTELLPELPGHLQSGKPVSPPWLLLSEPTPHRDPFVELLLVDETERLSTTGLDYLRDLFDRYEIGLVLIGMPGIEKRLSRYPQLYSRVGFSHQYRPLQDAELTFVLTRRWRELGLGLDEAEFTDAQAVATIVRITRGNFRLLHRLFIQIERVLRSNDLHTITAEVVDAARSTLVIGDI